MITQNFLTNYYEVLQKDLADINILTNHRKKIIDEMVDGQNSIFSKIKNFSSIIDDIKSYGTPQFSRQARYAFISKSLCNSLAKMNYLTKEQIEQFMLSIVTVASNFEKDFNLYLEKKISREEFNNGYGHLRAGTYDIRADRYDQILFTNIKSNSFSKNSFVKTQPKLNSCIKNIHQALKHSKLNINESDFLEILKSAFEQREYFKFEFTKSLSLAIEILRSVGNTLNLSYDSLSYLEVDDIKAAENFTEIQDLKNYWVKIIEQRKKNHKNNGQLILPEIITTDKDLNIVKITRSRPNFITNKSIVGEIYVLENNFSEDISGKIIVIKKADPGFDWIFAKGIAGLITMYGGVASHMAIRCAEFGIPAAIGCGEKIFDYVTKLKKIELNCKEEKIFERN
jgi:phosphohistidine swiveling domain-containing protein